MLFDIFMIIIKNFILILNNGKTNYNRTTLRIDTIKYPSKCVDVTAYYFLGVSLEKV